MQLRHMEIVTDKDKLNVDIQATCMKYKTIKQWAYILHDKDDTRPHYHIYLNFGNSSCDTALVASWFEIGENFISKVKGRKTDMLLYLTHGNDTQKNKHQYAPEEVKANFDFVTEIKNAEIIGDFDNHSYAEQLQYVNKLPVSEKVKEYTRLEKLWKLYCQTALLNAERKIDVVFICGKAGTGKTYYAKKMLRKMGYDFCVSSSSNDPFQDYLGQNAIILDDLRDRSFENMEDLLKILDNNTASSVRSRFANKVFNGKIIVVTSSVPLQYWYPLMRSNRNDSLDQLYRRFTCYIEVTRDTVTIFNDGVGNDGKPQGTGIIYANELKEKAKVREEKTDFGKVFESFLPAGSIF